jgi:hypothetical protein
VVTAHGIALAAGAASSDWRREVVPRFGAAAEIPSRGFVALPDPENRDGRMWESSTDGGTITLYGGFIVVTPDFASYRAWREEAERESGTRITYRAGGKDWFVISGRNGNRIVYERIENACGGEAFVAIRFDYPAVAAKRWDAVVKRGAERLEALEAEACG